jgi:cyclic beta-1,2-glucan synthetase
VHAACYDLLASEARSSAFLAIAKGDIAQESWFLLSRSHVVVYGHAALISWTGTMFEYLMPMLWMRSYPETMLEKSKESSVLAQQMYAEDKGIPWGISECAFAKVEENGAYGYRAFGVPQLALQQDEDRLVVAPYATMLALGIDPAAAIKNLRWMTKKGWFGTYGYYEAADFTRDVRPSRRQPFALVRSWMVHHQGMGLLAIANFLRDGIVQQWFNRDARVQATELLLQERPAGRVAAKPQKKRSGKGSNRKPPAQPLPAIRTTRHRQPPARLPTTQEMWARCAGCDRAGPCRRDTRRPPGSVRCPLLWLAPPPVARSHVERPAR